MVRPATLRLGVAILALLTLQGCALGIGAIVSSARDLFGDQVDADDLIDGDVEWRAFGVVTGRAAVAGDICYRAEVRFQSSADPNAKYTINLQDGFNFVDFNANDRNFLPVPPDTYSVTGATCYDGNVRRTFTFNNDGRENTEFSRQFSVERGQVLDIGVVEFRYNEGSRSQGVTVMRANTPAAQQRLIEALEEEGDRFVSWQDVARERRQDHREQRMAAFERELDEGFARPQAPGSITPGEDGFDTSQAAVYLGVSATRAQAEGSAEFMWLAESDLLGDARPVVQERIDPGTGLPGFHIYGADLPRFDAQAICDGLDNRGYPCSVVGAQE